MSTAFELTPEQRNILANSSVPLPIAWPGADQQYVIIDKGTYERLKELSQIDEVDPSFFDCEEIDPPTSP